MSALHRHLLAVGPRRLLAAGGVALVLLLAVLAAHPELHHFLHSHDASGREDGCAVTLFASGVSVPFDTALVAATPAIWLALVHSDTIEIFLASPRYLHQPERGPPVN